MINNESITENFGNNIQYLDNDAKIRKIMEDFESIIYKKNVIILCKNCKSTPDIIILKDNNKRVFFTCQNCGTAESEKIEKIGNYFSNWINLLSKDIIYKNSYENYFTNVTNIAKNSTNIKYKVVLNSLKLLDKKKDINNGKKIGEIEEKIIKVFDKDLQELKYLLIFTNILYNTYEVYNIEQYKEIFDKITQFFNNEKFINNINSIKNNCLASIKDLTLDEIKNLKKDIEEILQKNMNFDGSSGCIKIKNFIEKNVNFSTNLKNYNKNVIAKNSDNYLDINDILYHVSNQHKIIGSLENNKFVLSLFGKCFEKNGTKIYISNQESQQFKNIDICSLYSLLLCNNQKKYEIYFNYTDKDIKNILSNDNKEKFINKNKIMIAKTLNKNKEKIIVNIGKQNDSLVLYVIILDSDLDIGKNLMNLKGNYHIIDIKEKPLFEDVILYPSLVEENNIINGSINEFIIGGENYYQPIGWIEKKLKIIDNQGEFINNINNQEEFSIAYLGLDNYLNDDEYQQKIDELNDYYGNIRKMIINKLYKNDIDIKNNEKFCGDGICVFPNPDYAENMAGIIDIYGCIYKVIVMCKINVKKIRQPKTYSYCWIINPTPDEIIPYKILIKEQYCSPLLPNDSLIIANHPENYIIKAIRSNDFSFYNLKKEKRFKFIKEAIRNNNEFFVISLYTSVYFGFINEYLRTQNVLDYFRKHKGFTEDQLKSWICCLNLALSRNKNVKDFQVTYRAISNYKFPDNINEGDKFYLREFISTSKSKKFCKDWLRDSEGTLLEITIKNNGTNGHPNYCFYIDDILTVSKGQEEILISSHCSYTITEIKRGKVDEISLICEGNLINEISSNYNYTLEIRYKIFDSQNVRIFGEKFVENNLDKCKILINDDEKTLCSTISLNNIKLEGNNLKIKLILKGDIIDMSYMFCDCDSLLSIFNFPDLDTNKVTKMNHMFSGCKLLLALPDISNWDTSNVTTISSMFCDCKLLESIPDISKWNTSKVTDMSYLFSGCESLNSLPDISIWNTNNVIDITSIFENCLSLTNLPDISKWNTAKVNKMGGIFSNCSLLESVPDISKWDTTNVTHTNGIFNECLSLKKVPDISKWDTSNIKYKENMFYGCSSLESLPDLKKWNNKK